MPPQSLNYKRIRQRIKRSLNFGTKSPRSLHLPLSEMVVDYFNHTSPYDYMKPETSANISTSGFADTCTLVVAMVYLDRLRHKKRHMFETTDPAEMYVPSLVLASKYLHDSDVDERVPNEEWAELLDLTAAEFSPLEWRMVESLDWNVAVTEEEFYAQLSTIERWVAADFVRKHGFMTYNEGCLLVSSMSIVAFSEYLAMLAKVLAMCTVVYCASVASLLVSPMVLPSSLPSSLSSLPALPAPLPPLPDSISSLPSPSHYLSYLSVLSQRTRVVRSDCADCEDILNATYPCPLPSSSLFSLFVESPVLLI